MSATVPDDIRAIVPRRVRGYTTKDGVVQGADLHDVSENLPAGGHLSTAGDLVRFAIAWNEGELVSDASKAAMWARPEYVDRSALKYYGYGIEVDFEGGEGAKREAPLLLHTGSQAGTKPILQLEPRSGIVVALMLNLDDPRKSRRELAREILRIIEGKR